MINQEQFNRLHMLCNDILTNIAANNMLRAKRQSWLLHEVICTNIGEFDGKEKEANRE